MKIVRKITCMFSLVLHFFVCNSLVAEVKKIGPEKITLNKTTIWNLESLIIEDGTIIETNGHIFAVMIKGDLTIDGSAKIFSFAPERFDEFPAPPSPKAGKKIGTSYNPGPQTGGRRPARDGGAGANGDKGGKGVNGRSARPIVFNVAGKAEGVLVIRNQGENGQPGGQGGQGGRGGTGEQGGRAKTKRDFGIVTGCKSGPSHGGNGGRGGDGGQGGDGGNGGNGGEIWFQVLMKSPGFKLDVFSDGGKGGVAGKPGQGGKGGDPGFGGRGATGCEGRETERRGNPGEDGKPGPNGRSGIQGKNGSLNIEIKE